jgi:hypothetical protein
MATLRGFRPCMARSVATRARGFVRVPRGSGLSLFDEAIFEQFRAAGLLDGRERPSAACSRGPLCPRCAHGRTLNCETPDFGGFSAGRTGLEPATSGVTGRRYNQLNYRPSGGPGEWGRWPLTSRADRALGPSFRDMRGITRNGVFCGTRALDGEYLRSVISTREAAFAALALVWASGCEGDAVAHVQPASSAEREAEDYPHLVARHGIAEDVHADDRWVGKGVALHRVSAEGDAWMEVAAEAGGGVRTFPKPRLPLARSDRATLLIRAEAATPEQPVEVELAFYDALRGNRFWRPLTLEDGEWQELDVDLAHLRYDRGAVPRWEDVTSWGLEFQTASTVDVRGLTLWQDGSNASPYLSERDLRSAFAAPSLVRVGDRAPFVVLTDDPRLDIDSVLEALIEMDTRMRGRFPDLPTPDRPVPLLVFSTEESYRTFWRQFAARAGARAGPLAEDEGYTWMGVATTYYSDEYGLVRPTYVHEASHALLERSLGLAAQRSWLFEGLGVFDQLEVSRQDLRFVYAQGLRRSDLKMPVDELVSGKPIPTSRYWQATLLMEWILVDAERTAALAAALEDMRRRGSADLRWLVSRHFDMDMATFTAEFWGWATDTYGR